jgi:glycosyltransferase involved in cell wall biosynthesis
VESALVLPEVAEVILVEDGSPDGALAVCEELSQLDRVTLLRHSDGANHGAGASRNLGARHTNAEFIAFLDADDWYLPNRFRRDCEILADPAVDGVYNAIQHRFESDTLRKKWLAQGRPEITTIGSKIDPHELIDVLMWAHPVRGDFSTIGVTVRLAFFWRVGGFHEPLRLQQDTHLWKRMAAAGRLEAGSIDEPVAVASVHPGNRMTNLEEQERFREIWWESLLTSFRELRVSGHVMQLWRRGYSGFCASRGRRWKALATLADWSVHDPRRIAEPYGHFDVTMRRIFEDSNAVIRILSIKNRLLS